MPINVQFEYQIIPAFVTCLQCSYPDTISWAFTKRGGSEICLLYFCGRDGYTVRFKNSRTFIHFVHDSCTRC